MDRQATVERTDESTRTKRVETGTHYIPSQAEPWHYALKQGQSFALFDQHGDIDSEPDRADGLYHRDTRVLSRWRLLFNGHQPLFLSSTLRDDKIGRASCRERVELSVAAVSS